jgi:hypothetical protein
VRGDCDGGTLSSEFGPMIRRGVDPRIRLTERLSAAFDDRRHPSYITHPLRDLIAQRVDQIACASPRCCARASAPRGWRTP